MEDAVGVDRAVAEDLGRDPVSGPSLESAVAVVNSFMFEASGRERPGAAAQSDLPVSASTTSSPLAEPPPWRSQERIWSQLPLA